MHLIRRVSCVDILNYVLIVALKVRQRGHRGASQARMEPTRLLRRREVKFVGRLYQPLDEIGISAPLTWDSIVVIGGKPGLDQCALATVHLTRELHPSIRSKQIMGERKSSLGRILNVPVGTSHAQMGGQVIFSPDDESERPLWIFDQAS